MSFAERLDVGPYDVALDGRAFMLAEEVDAKGQPTGKMLWKQEKVKFSPGGPSPESEPYTVEPTVEIPQVFSVWRNGAGWREQPDESSKDANGYFYTRFMEKAGIYMAPSPAVTAFTPATTDSSSGGNQFIEYTLSGTRTLFCAMGRYLLKRVSDSSWTKVGPGGSNDLGAGAKITGMAVYRGQQSGSFLMLAWQNSSGVAQNYYVWDGTSWTQMSNAAVDFVKYRDEVWMLSQDSTGRWQVQKDVTGGTSAVWGGGFIVADGSETCSHLVINQDRLFIRSTLGLLGVSAAENDAQQITGDAFKTQFQALNQCRPVAFAQWVVMQTASTLFVYDAQSGGVNEIGLGTLQNNDSGIATGVHTCAAPYRFWTMYTWTYNAANTTAYLWRFGEYETIDTLYSPVPYKEELPSLYGSVYEQTAQVNGMLVSEIGGTTPRLYWVDALGVISFMALSRFNSNPYSDPAVPAATSWPGGASPEIYLPACLARNAVEVKANAGIALTGKNFSASTFYTASYRTDPAATFGGAANLDNGGQFLQAVSQRNNWTTDVHGAWLDVKLTVANNSSTAPPMLKACVIYQVMRPVFKWVYTGVFRLGARVHGRNGSNRGRLYDVAEDRMFLENLAGPTGFVTVVTPDGTSVQVLVTNLSLELQRREPEERPEWYATVEMTEHRPLAINGTYLRLEPFTYTYLSGFSYAQLEVL